MKQKKKKLIFFITKKAKSRYSQVGKNKYYQTGKTLSHTNVKNIKLNKFQQKRYT